MVTSVVFRDEPEEVLDIAGDFLASQPVINNLMLTLLHDRVTVPEPGHYWVAADGDEVVGVVFQSPPGYPALVTPMPQGSVAPVVAAVTQAGGKLPGLHGDPATAARFAGSWTEWHGAAARPVEGQRIYEVERLVTPAGVSGAIRPAGPADRDLLVAWLRAFTADVGGISAGDPSTMVDRRLPGGHYWIWDDAGPVAMAARSGPVGGVTRIRGVYTPPEQRGRGYAAACVAAVSAGVLDAGHRCILSTQLENPTSNGVYRRIGYRAVAESLRYEFT
jgi:GNAT superfamily N-acetyltransferase